MRIVAVCSLCGHEYAGLFDAAELDAHMAGAHEMYFVPGSPKPGDPPRWVRSPHIDQASRAAGRAAGARG